MLWKTVYDAITWNRFSDTDDPFHPLACSEQASFCRLLKRKVNNFLFSIYWPCLRLTRLIAWLYQFVFGMCGTVHMNKDCSLISPSFLWFRVSPNKSDHHVGDSLGDTLIYTSRGVYLCYCCLLQKYKEAFKRKLSGAVLCLPLIAVHSRKCHIILWKVLLLVSHCLAGNVIGNYFFH